MQLTVLPKQLPETLSPDDQAPLAYKGLPQKTAQTEISLVKFRPIDIAGAHTLRDGSHEPELWTAWNEGQIAGPSGGSYIGWSKGDRSTRQSIRPMDDQTDR